MNPAVFVGLLLSLGAALVIAGVGLLAGAAWALVTAGVQLLGMALLLRGSMRHGG